MDTEENNQQQDDGYTGHADLPIESEGIGPIDYLIGGLGAIAIGLEGRAAVKAGEAVEKAFGKAVVAEIKDWGIGQVADKITDSLFKFDHAQVQHSHPNVDALHMSGSYLSPGDANMTDLHGHPVHADASPITTWDPSQRHDTHNFTPADANMTDLHGHPVHVDASPTTTWDPSQGHDTHNFTPGNTTMTEPHDHAGSSSSPEASLWDPSSGHDTHNFTPGDTTMTEPHDYSVHVDTSNAGYDPGHEISSHS